MRPLRRILLFEEHVCPWWLAYTFDNPLRRLIHPPERVLGAWVGAGMTVVDVGCGMGHFALGMAEIVGERGRVVAVDLQSEMLEVVSRRARRRGLAERIALHRGGVEELELATPADFALSFWMVHEVEAVPAFMARVFRLLKAGGRYLIAEPRVHVTAERCGEIFEAAASAGFRREETPSIRLSRAQVFAKHQE